MVWTNCPHHLQWNAPCEGHKLSGLGEDLGMASMTTFTKLKRNYIDSSGKRFTWAAESPESQLGA
jgi:hypothetical protein